MARARGGARHPGGAVACCGRSALARSGRRGRVVKPCVPPGNRPDRRRPCSRGHEALVRRLGQVARPSLRQPDGQPGGLDTEWVDLFIDAAGGRGLSEQLYEQIRGAIAAGRLRPGDQLPPSRDTARQLGISRHTVTTAYGRLVAEGFVCGRAGGGSFVAGLPVPEPGPGSGVAAAPTAIKPARRYAGWTPAGGPLQPAEVRYDLRAGLADRRLFPAGAWYRAGRVAAEAGGRV